MKCFLDYAKRISAVAFGATLALAVATQAIAQQQVILRGITPWTADYDLSKAFFTFQKLVNEKLKGKLSVVYLGGPEVAAPNQQFQALKNGVVDVILGAAAYYRTEVPLGWAIQFAKKTPSELRKTGYYDLMHKIHLEQGGVVYLANTAAGGSSFRLYLTKKIDKPDLTGLKIRVSPVYTPLVTALGGTPISMAPGEIFTGVERGVVDGYGWTYTGIDVFGLQEVTKYIIDHPFYSLDTAILINKDVYEKLSPELKKGLEEAAIELEQQNSTFYQDSMKKEDGKLRKQNINFIRFSPADAERFIKTAYDAGWKDFAEKNANSLQANPALLDQLKAMSE